MSEPPPDPRHNGFVVIEPKLIPPDCMINPSGMQAVAQLVRYVYCVYPELQYREFRATIRKQLPESEEAVMTIAEQLIQQGRAEGRAEGRIELLERQILEKFGALPPTLHERLASATDEQFDRWCRRVLRAETLDAMFAD